MSSQSLISCLQTWVSVLTVVVIFVSYTKNWAELLRLIVCRAANYWFQNEISKNVTLLEKPQMRE